MCLYVYVSEREREKEEERSISASSLEFIFNDLTCTLWIRIYPVFGPMIMCECEDRKSSGQAHISIGYKWWCGKCMLCYSEQICLCEYEWNECISKSKRWEIGITEGWILTGISVIKSNKLYGWCMPLSFFSRSHRMLYLCCFNFDVMLLPLLWRYFNVCVAYLCFCTWYLMCSNKTLLLCFSLCSLRVDRILCSIHSRRSRWNIFSLKF